MKKTLIVLVALLITQSNFAQKYISEKSTVTFFSEATIENIAATNSKAKSVFNSDDGALVYAIPIDEFQFEKSLMQEHFNEKYMDTDKYPKSTFKGKVLSFTKDIAGIQKVSAKGELTIHGVTKEIEVPGSIEFKDGKVLINATFIAKLEDYKVKIPKLMWQNIAEQVEVKVNFQYKEYAD